MMTSSELTERAEEVIEKIKSEKPHIIDIFLIDLYYSTRLAKYEPIPEYQPAVYPTFILFIEEVEKMFPDIDGVDQYTILGYIKYILGRQSNIDQFIAEKTKMPY